MREITGSKLLHIHHQHLINLNRFGGFMAIWVYYFDLNLFDWKVLKLFSLNTGANGLSKIRKHPNLVECYFNPILTISHQ